MKLIKLKNKNWQLSKDGLNLILDIQKHHDSNKKDKLIIFLTFILALGTIVQIVNFCFSPKFNLSKLLGFIFLGVIILYGLKRLLK